MARFYYRALTEDGEIAEDVIDAPDRDSVVLQLRGRNCRPVVVLPAAEAPAIAGGEDAQAPPRPRRPWLATGGGRRAALGLIQSLEVLLSAGVGLDRALGVIAQTQPHAPTARAAADMADRLAAGASLDAAMAAHPALFDRFAIAMARAGEAGGDLAASLGRLARYWARAEALQGAIRAALAYPAFLLLATLAALLLILVYVLPEFALLFRQQAAEPPPTLRFLFALGAAARDYGWAVLALGLALWLILRGGRWRRAMPGLDRALLTMPGLGPLLIKIEMERFARVLAALLGANVGLIEALGLAGGVIRNRTLSQRFAGAAGRIEAGAPLSRALAQAGPIPASMREYIRIGEETGRLAPMLERLADGYAAEIETGLKTVQALLGPVLVVLMGLVVAAIVLTLYGALIGVNQLAG